MSLVIPILNYILPSIDYFFNSVKPNEYCIRITGGRTNTPGCASSWQSSPVTLFRNGNEVGILSSGYYQEDFCFPIDQVDSKNDIFELLVNGSDGVSIIKICTLVTRPVSYLGYNDVGYNLMLVTL